MFVDLSDPRSRKSVEKMLKQVRLEPGENVHYFFDASRWGSGSKGFVVTDFRVIDFDGRWQNSIPLAAIETAGLDMKNKVLSIFSHGKLLNLGVPGMKRGDEAICQAVVSFLQGGTRGPMMPPGGFGRAAPAWPGHDGGGGETIGDVLMSRTRENQLGTAGTFTTHNTRYIEPNDDEMTLPGRIESRKVDDRGAHINITTDVTRLACGCLAKSVDSYAGFCAVCGQPVCKIHFFNCYNCGKPICVRHRIFLDGKPYCSERCYNRKAKKDGRIKKRKAKQEEKAAKKQHDDSITAHIEQVRAQQAAERGKGKSSTGNAWIIKKSNIGPGGKF